MNTHEILKVLQRRYNIQLLLQQQIKKVIPIRVQLI